MGSRILSIQGVELNHHWERRAKHRGKGVAESKFSINCNFWLFLAFFGGGGGGTKSAVS